MKIDPYGVSALCEEMKFDSVVDTHHSNEDMYAQLRIDDMVTSAMEGFSETIFAYGQTGSGKSYTIIGNAHTPGILPRTTKSLFTKLQTQWGANAGGGSGVVH